MNSLEIIRIIHENYYICILFIIINNIKINYSSKILNYNTLQLA